jgi:hypothetical protein
MKEHCSTSSIGWARIFTSICILILECTGCGKPPMFHFVASDNQPIETHQYKIFLKGRDLGTVTGSGKLEFDAEGRGGNTPKEMLPQDIEVKIPWDCGWVKTSFDLYEPSADEIERARAEHRAISATIGLNFIPPPSDLITIFFDNRGEPQQTVSIGELNVQVPAGVARSVELPYSGGCEKAKDVRLNGEVIAPANTPRGQAPTSARRTLLIDVAGSHCYRIEYAGYGVPISGYGNTIYRPRPYQYLESNPDGFMEPLPGSVEVPEYQMGATRETLKGVACPKR